MAVAALGLRGSGSFAADERPRNWRQGIMLMFPNGDCPLTALLSMLPDEPTDDPVVHWFEKGLPTYRGLIVGASTTVNAKPADDADIAAADATAEIALAVKPDGGAEDDVTWLKPGHVLVNETTEENYLVIKVGADYINVRRDIGNKFASNPAVTGHPTTGDPISIVGTGFQEGAPVGEVISYSPLRHHNFTQIFRTPLSLTRTARRTKLRYDKTGPYMEAKREALQLHGTELERALMWGEREEITSLTAAASPLIGAANPLSSARPLRTLRGIVNWLPTINTTATPSVHWDIGTANGGAVTETHFENWLEEIFRYGSPEKVCFAGSKALNVLNQLAKNKMTITAVPTDRTYGMAFNRYITPFGDLLVKQHPLMSHNPTWRKDLVVLDTAHIRLRILDDTAFLRNRQSPGEDASIDEFLTELSLEVRFSGATSSSDGGLAAAAGPAVHGRLKGLNELGG